MWGFRRDGDDTDDDGTGDDYEEARQRMLESIRRRVDRESTLEAMYAVPRHEFVPAGKRNRAYQDRPLPIGNGQTISAPHMVAEMCDRLDLAPGEDVLEIGTGCGYHAAVTAELVGADHVYTVEFDPELGRAAEKRLEELGYGAIHVRIGDGHEGWPEHAPYDAAYLTCAAPAFPEAVIEQVRPGGRLLGPIGTGRQRLVRARKREDGDLDRETLGGVRFVEMRGG